MSVERLVFDTGLFLLLFTKESGSDNARSAILRHEEGEIEIYINLNNLAEAYMVITKILRY